MKEKAEVLRPVFAKLLSSRYPELEENIFNSMGQHEAGLQGVATGYPELKSVQGFKALVEQMNQLYGDCYDRQLKIMDMIMVINRRTVNPFLFSSLLPDIPDDIAGIEDKFGMAPIEL